MFDYLLFWLLVLHAVADYPLQGDFLARGKNHRDPLPDVPWAVCLAAHSMIHAGCVALVTESTLFGMFEFVAHAAIDFSKSEGWFGTGERAFWIDQGLHVLCKGAWILLFILWR